LQYLWNWFLLRKSFRSFECQISPHWGAATRALVIYWPLERHRVQWLLAPSLSVCLSNCLPISFTTRCLSLLLLVCVLYFLAKRTNKEGKLCRFDKMPAKMPARHMRHLNNSQKSRSQKENLRKNQDVKKRGRNTRKSPTKMLMWFVVCVKICLKQIVLYTLGISLRNSFWNIRFNIVLYCNTAISK